MGEDDPVDRAQALLLDESTHRAEAARIARVDDGETFVALVQVGLCATHAGDPVDHGRLTPGGGTSTGAGGGSWISGCDGCGASSGPGGSPTCGGPGFGITGSFSIAISLT